MRFLNLPLSSLIAILAQSNIIHAQASDPCAEIGGLEYTTIDKVHACYNSIPLTAEQKADHIASMKDIVDMYPFTDLAKDTSAPLFASKVDLVGELDKLAADNTIKTQFDLFTRITLLVASLNDGHFSYYPKCVNTFLFMQPWSFHATYTDGLPTIKILNINPMAKTYKIPEWQDVAKYVNYTVISIDNVEAVKYVQDYADQYSGVSRSPDTRFNYVLGIRGLDSTVDKITYIPGSMTNSGFLGFGANSNRTYTLTAPGSAEKVIVSIPWFAAPPNTKFTSSADYARKFCVPEASSSQPLTASKFQTSSRTRKIGLIEKPLPSWDLILSYVGSNTPDPIVLANIKIAQELRKFGGAPSTTAALDLSQPLVGDQFNKFYMLSDGVTGVFFFSTFAPTEANGDDLSESEEAKWVATMIDGLRALDDAGYVCVSKFLTKYLVSDIPYSYNNLRLTKSTRALLTAEYYGEKNSQLIPINTTDILKPTYKKTRGGVESEFTGFFASKCKNSDLIPNGLKPLSIGWNPEQILIMSDGFCGSACAIMTRSLRDGANVKTMVMGGASGKPFTPTSFEGGVIAKFAALTAAGQSLVETQYPDLPKPFKLPTDGQIPVTEGYSPLGKFGLEYPAEWVPAPAELWIPAAHGEKLETIWNMAAAKFAEASGVTTTVTGTAKPPRPTVTRKPVDVTPTTTVVTKLSGASRSTECKIEFLKSISVPPSMESSCPAAESGLATIHHLIKTFVPKYVRSLTCPGNSRTEGKIEELGILLEHVKAGKVFIEEAEMVVAMIDISGYSKIASALAILGKISSELISNSVGRYMRSLMLVVDEFGGDVIKFLGDAILVTFTKQSDDESMEDVVLRAAASGAVWPKKEVQRIATKSNGDKVLPESSDFTLSLHIGLLFGKFQHVILGDYNSRLECCVNGETLSDLSKLLDGTVAGEMALSNRFVQVLDSFGNWDPPLGHSPLMGSDSVILNVDHNWDSFAAICFEYQRIARPVALGEYRTTLSQKVSKNDDYSTGKSTTSQNEPLQATNNVLWNDEFPAPCVDLPDPLFRFVNTSVLSRVVANNQLSFKPDYRRVSVMFVKLEDKFTAERTQSVLMEFIAAVRHFNGVFQHFSIDDKGQNILAFFGLPPFVHENAALFATKATLKLLTVQNFASNITIDSSTKDLISKDFKCIDIGHIKVKGKEESIHIWGLLETEHTAKREYPLVKETSSYIGYTGETALLLDGFQSWRKMQGGFWALVQGESGSGKSCLMSKISKKIMEEGQDIFTFSEETTQRGRSGSVASSMTNFGAGQEYSLKDFELLLMACGENRVYSPLLAQTLPWLKFELAESVEKLTTAAKNSIIANLYLKLLNRYLSRGDCVLVLDDAQWIDSVSLNIYLQLFEMLGLSSQHCCLIFSRPITSDFENGLERIAKLPNTTNLSIHGLGKDDIISFMNRLLAAKEIPSEIVDAIYRHTGGNIIQTQMICETLKLQRENVFDEPNMYKGIKDRALFEKIVFGTSSSIISAQLDRLAPQFKKLLQCSSILGQYFNLEDVVYLFKPDLTTVDDLIEMIRQHDQYAHLSFSVNGLDAGANSTAGRTFCSFRHIRIMYAIYDSISVAERTFLHERIAELYETLVQDGTIARNQLLPSLHHHYSKTTNAIKMVSFGEECGNALYKSGIYRESTVYFTKCVEYWQTFSTAPISDKQKGAILSKLSFCLIFPFTGMERGIKAAVEALGLAGEKWGDDKDSASAIMKKDLKRLIRFWILSREGRKDIQFKKEKERRLYKEWYPIIRDALYALSNAALCDTTMLPEMKTMILMKILVFALTEAETNSLELFNILLYFIFGLFNNPTKSKLGIARYLSKQTQRLLARNGKKLNVHFLLYGAAAIFMNDDPTTAIAMFTSLTEFATEIQKLTHIARSYAWVWTAWLCNGVLEIPTVYNHPLVYDVVREDPAWVALSMYGPLTCSFLKDDLEGFCKFLAFQQQAFQMIPQRSLAMVRIHRKLFELMESMMRRESETVVEQNLSVALLDCDSHMGRERDVSFAYSLVFALMLAPKLKTSNLHNMMEEIIQEKLKFYIKHSIQGAYSKFNCFLMQVVATQLGKSQPPTKFARELRKVKGLWAPDGDFRFLGSIGQAILLVHLPKLASRNWNEDKLAGRFRERGALLLEAWVKGERKFIS
ncbi:hypothetical protein HDU97_009421 [Phlyctochytrium planicorne]|nr:hypothetical protein HDU97_009421 [Phlyctochytrium planicorne]